jgi:ferredoxin like protein
MSRRNLPEIGFEERMASVEFRVASRPHIVLHADTCHGCTARACVTACPAGLFVVTGDGSVVFNHERCFECGTCYLVCNEPGALDWSYPEGGHGVVFARG